MTITATATATATGIDPATSSSSTEAAIGAGIDVPLGLALVGALGMLMRQRRREQGWKRKVESWEEKYEALARMKGVEYRDESGEFVPREGGLNQQLEHRKVNESESSQANNVYEMDLLRDGRQ